MFNNSKKNSWQRISLSILFMCVGAFQAEAASPQKDIKAGNLFYEQGDYVASEEKYKEALEKDPESDIVNFNLGAALYKKEQYQEAKDYFQKVFLSEDEQLKLSAYYNSGNALYKMGISEEQKGSAALAILPVESSLKQYERALEIDAEDEDTKHNYAFVQEELKRLQEIEQQQQQQGQGEDSQDSQESEGQEQQESQQSQDNQDQQGQQNQEQQQDSQNQQQEQGDERDDQQQQDQQSDSEQEQGQGEGEEDNNKQNTGTQPQSASELTPQEALMLLEGYQQTEEPQEPLNMQPKINNPEPVFNDW